MLVLEVRQYRKIAITRQCCGALNMRLEKVEIDNILSVSRVLQAGLSVTRLGN